MKCVSEPIRGDRILLIKQNIASQQRAVLPAGANGTMLSGLCGYEQRLLGDTPAHGVLVRRCRFFVSHFSW